MDASRRLQLLLDLDELKNDTTCTRQIVEAIRKLTCLEGEQKVELQQLVKRIRHSYVKMLDSVKRRRSVTSKLDKLYRQFHEFSICKGFELCISSEQAIGIKVPETLWQLLLEKEFTSFMTIVNLDLQLIHRLTQTKLLPVPCPILRRMQYGIWLDTLSENSGINTQDKTNIRCIKEMCSSSSENRSVFKQVD